MCKRRDEMNEKCQQTNDEDNHVGIFICNLFFIKDILIDKEQIFNFFMLYALGIRIKSDFLGLNGIDFWDFLRGYKS
jgi:hypothetical protein